MTNREFNEWVIELCRLFPSIKGWFEGLADGGQAVIEVWRGVLAPEEATDAKMALRAILSGEAEPMPTFEREYCGRHVRDVCAWIRQRREDSRRKRDEQRSNERYRSAYDGRRKPLGQSSRSIMGQILDLMAAESGLSAHDAAERILPPSDPHGQPRYGCHYCLDSGKVLIWSARAIRACLNDTLGEPANRSVCAAPCSCQVGERFVWRGSGEPPRNFFGWRSADAVFSVDRHCHCPNGDTESAGALASFREWVADFKSRWEQSRRVSEFDDWNATSSVF